MGVASLVLGIVGLVFSFIPCLGSWGIFLTVPGVILGAVGLASAAKKNAPKGLAIAGLVCSIIGSAIAGYQWYVLHKASDAITEFGTEFGKAMDEAAKKDKMNKELQKEAESVKKALDAAKPPAK